MLDEFQACLFSYDEGLLSSDQVLAAALWRNLFQHHELNPEMLEKMVDYVRQQIFLLEKIDKEVLLLGTEPINWIKLKF